MKIKFLLYLYISVFMFCNLFAEGDPEQIKCGMKGSQQLLDRPLNGQFKPARTGQGEYFRILIAFAQFASDTRPDIVWPVNQLPNWANSIIDTAVSTTYPDGYRDETLSDYFDKASLGKFSFIGDVFQDITIIPTDMNYSDANLYVLEKLKKNIKDFRKYDNWKYQGNTFVFSKGNGLENDGNRYLDMLIIIYRNAVDSVFGTPGGIAELGLKNDFIIDSTNNVTVTKSNADHNLDNYQGGITTKAGLSGKFAMVGHIAHEFGHYLFGVDHNMQGGLMTGAPYLYEGGTFMMNGWERAYLGYITPKVAATDGEQDTLRDFVKYGDVLKINDPVDDLNSSVFYIIENHQRLSKYDQIMRGKPLDGNYNLNTKVGNGIYMWYFISGSPYRYPPATYIKAANGAWSWALDGTFYAPGFYENTAWRDTVPKTKRIAVDRGKGTSERDPLNIIWHNQWFPKWVDIDPFTGKYELTRDFMGEENNAYNIGYNQLLTPWSNPSSFITDVNNISLELVSKVGRENNYILRFYSTEASALALPPSKPANLKADRSNLYIKLMWESNVEPDVISGGSYIVYRSSSINGKYIRIGSVQHKINSAEQTFIDTTYPGGDYYYKVAVLDNTNKVSLLSDAVVTYTLFASSIEIWSGNINLKENIKVPVGKTLIIKAGTTLNFRNQSHLSVDGTLITEGINASNVVIDFGAISTLPANCIYANAGSKIFMDYTEIKNGGLALFAGDAQVQINHCNFHDTYKPILLYSTTGYSYNSSIKNTHIHNSKSEGIWIFNYNTVYLDNNIIENNLGEGLRLLSGSCPLLNKNTIQYNQNGITAVLNCIPELLGYNFIANYIDNGVYLKDHSIILANNGFNNVQIPNDGHFYIYADFYCDAEIQYNYWNSNSVDLNKFSFDKTSNLDYSNWLFTNPNAGTFLHKTVQKSNLEMAYDEFVKGNYINAEGIFQKVVEEELNENESHYALAGLAACYNKTNMSGLINYLNEKLKPRINSKKDDLYKEYLELYINCLIQERRYDDAINNLHLINDNYILDGESKKELILKLGVTELILKNDIAQTKSIFEEISSNYLDQRTKYDLDIILSAFNNGVFSNLKNVKPELSISGNIGHVEEIPYEYRLEQNYPNPFNLETKIKYELPQSSMVVLEVYNILGEKLSTLINGNNNAGYHEIIFDASNLSSGIYIYKLTATSLEMEQRFVKSAKMVIIK